MLGWLTPSFILTENELLQNEVATVTTGDAAGSGSKSPPSLRRRKRTCSRRQGEKEKEREVGGMGSGDRADKGVREQRDRREASKSAWKQLCCCVYSASLYWYQYISLSRTAYQLAVTAHFSLQTNQVLSVAVRGTNFILFPGETYLKLGEHSRGGGQNSISTILLIVSFMWVEFKCVFSPVWC